MAGSQIAGALLPPGRNLDFLHLDSLNRLSTVTDNRTGGVTNYSYDAANNVATVTYPNGVQTLFHYDALNRVMGATTQQTGYIYQRDAAGNLTSVTDANGRTVNWTYDGIYRLTGETISLDPAKHNGSVGYGLDPVGNRLSETSTLAGISSGSFGYNVDDELASETYDQNGNVLTSGGKSFTYDAENHLVAMNGGAVQMVYDAFGNRVAKSANGVTTRYLVDDLNPTGYPQVVDELTNGVVARTYAYGLQRISETQAVNNVLTTNFYGYDGMGTVRQLTNAAGTITDSYEYDAYGNHWTVEGSTPNNYLYRGEQWDADFGLYYLRARYYNPVTGRFMSKDLSEGHRRNSKSLHRYFYAGGNPVDYVDPRGTDLFEYAIESSASVPEAKLVSIYGCVSGASFAAASLILTDKLDWRAGVGAGGAVFGCVTLYFPESSENAIVQGIIDYTPSVNYVFCGFAMEAVVHDLNDLVEGKANAALSVVDAFGALNGCVTNRLGQLVDQEGRGAY